MIANIINGKEISENICESLAVKANEFYVAHNVFPCVALINIGNDSASKIYVSNKVKLAEKVGIKSVLHELPENVTFETVQQVIRDLNSDVTVHGILLQLPIPAHLDANVLTNMIDENKDVDGLTLKNIGRLSSNQDALFPCTPTGIVHVLKMYLGNNLSGLHAVVIGRSNIVGKPVAQMLLNENCTVTILHSKSQNPKEVCRTADIVIAAIGKPKFITSEWIKPGATVIDVGINRVFIDGKSKIVGDVDFENVCNVAKNITKVPGGIGPLTVTFLMYNTLKAANLQMKRGNYD